MAGEDEDKVNVNEKETLDRVPWPVRMDQELRNSLTRMSEHVDVANCLLTDGAPEQGMDILRPALALLKKISAIPEDQNQLGAWLSEARLFVTEFENAAPLASPCTASLVRSLGMQHLWYAAAAFGRFSIDLLSKEQQLRNSLARIAGHASVANSLLLANGSSEQEMRLLSPALALLEKFSAMPEDLNQFATWLVEAHRSVAEFENAAPLSSPGTTSLVRSLGMQHLWFAAAALGKFTIDLAAKFLWDDRNQVLGCGSSSNNGNRVEDLSEYAEMKAIYRVNEVDEASTSIDYKRLVLRQSNVSRNSHTAWLSSAQVSAEGTEVSGGVSPLVTPVAQVLNEGNDAEALEQAPVEAPRLPLQPRKERGISIKGAEKQILLEVLNEHRSRGSMEVLHFTSKKCASFIKKLVPSITRCDHTISCFFARNIENVVAFKQSADAPASRPAPLPEDQNNGVDIYSTCTDFTQLVMTQANISCNNHVACLPSGLASSEDTEVTGGASPFVAQVLNEASEAEAPVEGLVGAPVGAPVDGQNDAPLEPPRLSLQPRRKRPPKVVRARAPKITPAIKQMLLEVLNEHRARGSVEVRKYISTESVQFIKKLVPGIVMCNNSMKAFLHRNKEAVVPYIPRVSANVSCNNHATWLSSGQVSAVGIEVSGGASPRDEPVAQVPNETSDADVPRLSLQTRREMPRKVQAPKLRNPQMTEAEQQMVMDVLNQHRARGSIEVRKYNSTESIRCIKNLLPCIHRRHDNTIRRLFLRNKEAVLPFKC